MGIIKLLVCSTSRDPPLFLSAALAGEDFHVVHRDQHPVARCFGETVAMFFSRCVMGGFKQHTAFSEFSPLLEIWVH